MTPISVDADALPCGKFTNMLADLTQTNLVVNWNALAPAGVTRDTPITLHLKELDYELVVRTFMEVLPTIGTHANYVVDENTLEITTNHELGKIGVTKIYDVAKALDHGFGTPATTRAALEQNTQLLEAVLRAELRRAGEPMELKGHALALKDDTLAANVSDRGQTFINRAVSMFITPLKVGQLAPGTQYTTLSKRALDAYALYRAAPDAATPEALARAPRKYPQFNIALLPGTAEELARDRPDMGVAINEGGVLLAGPRAVLKARTALGVYDLRDVMKRLASKSKMTPLPGPAEFQAAIVQILQTEIAPEGDAWGGVEDLGKKPAVMVPYGGVLIVFATAETHRLVMGALQDMNK